MLQETDIIIRLIEILKRRGYLDNSYFLDNKEESRQALIDAINRISSDQRNKVTLHESDEIMTFRARNKVLWLALNEMAGFAGGNDIGHTRPFVGLHVRYDDIHREWFVELSYQEVCDNASST